MTTYGMTTESIAAAHAEAEDATAGLTDWEKVEAAKLSAAICMSVGIAADVGFTSGVVSDAGRFQVAVLRMALKTIEAMEAIHAPGGMAESDR